MKLDQSNLPQFLPTHQLLVHVFNVWLSKVLERKALVLIRQFQLCLRLFDREAVGDCLFDATAHVSEIVSKFTDLNCCRNIAVPRYKLRRGILRQYLVECWYP